MKNPPAQGKGKEKVLLALLPYWTPLIPPIGIASLKQFLQAFGCNVKTVDANIELEFREIYDKYFGYLRTRIPSEKRGNFYNTGHHLQQAHLTAHMHQCGKKNRDRYLELVQELVYKTFYTRFNRCQVLDLDEIAAEFYRHLHTYILRLLEEENPGVLGLTVYIHTFPASLYAFKLTKEKYPHIKTVMGGGIFTEQLATGSPNLEFFLEKTPYIDKIIMGEGEQIFLKLLKGKLPEPQRVFTLEDINGELLDLSTVDIPDYSDMDYQFYPYLASYASRSCPFNCTFCSEKTLWGRYRKKNVKQVVEELKKLYERHRFQLFLMGDSLLNPVITDLANEFINSDISIYWDGYLRVDKNACNTAAALLWRRGGFYRARLGVESGSQQILESMHKNITVEQIKMAISSLAYAGIKTTTYWIIGYPGETGEDFQQTLDLIEELKDDIYEAECNTFEFYLSGQVNSEEWNRNNKITPLYPEEAKDMFILQSWIMECEPSRQETYQRVSKFVKHCQRLGIVNPYSLHDITKGDKRWKKLHKNAVPAMIEFK